MRRYLLCLLAVVLVGSLLVCVHSQTGYTATLEPYVVGWLGDLTMPTRYIYAPELDGLRAYIEELNAKGGIEGRPVKLVAQDHKNDPARAATLAKKLIIEDKVLAILGLGFSTNHRAIHQEAMKEGVPLINGFTTVIPTWPPNPDKLCFTANWLMHSKLSPVFTYQAIAAQKLGFGKGTRVAALSFDSPSSRAVMDILEKWGKELGLEIVYRGEAPAGTIDLTPWAIKITQAKPDIYYHEAGLTEAIGIIPVLEKLGFNQTVIGSMSFLESEFSKAAALSRGIIKDFYMGDRYMYNYKGIEKDIPEYGRLMQAVKKYGIHGFSTGHNTVVGWIMGMIFEKACRKVGWPATRAALLGALETLEIDTRGLSGGPIHYSPTDHHGPSWWRVFKWDFKANEFKPFTDWWEFKLEQYMEK